jgi:hypothetical protein
LAALSKRLASSIAFPRPIDPVEELPSVFASSRINLNIHSVQCRGSLNQRDFNAPMAGGFLLSDWVPAAGRFFSPGIEAVYWSGIDDLRRKIAFYREKRKKETESFNGDAAEAFSTTPTNTASMKRSPGWKKQSLRISGTHVISKITASIPSHRQARIRS